MGLLKVFEAARTKKKLTAYRSPFRAEKRFWAVSFLRKAVAVPPSRVAMVSDLKVRPFLS